MHIREQMQLFDIGVKYQLLLVEFSTVVFWTSAAELLSLLLTFSLYLTQPKGMAPLWLFMMHVVRSIIGLVLVCRTPNQQRLILESADGIKGNERVTPGALVSEVKIAAAKSLKSFMDATRWLLLTYCVLTGTCIVFDFICFCYGVGWTTAEMQWWSFGVTNMLVLGSLFLSLDLLYVVWALSYIVKLPSPTGINTILALVGAPSRLANMLEDS